EVERLGAVAHDHHVVGDTVLLQGPQGQEDVVLVVFYQQDERIAQGHASPPTDFTRRLERRPTRRTGRPVRRGAARRPGVSTPLTPNCSRGGAGSAARSPQSTLVQAGSS